MPSQEEERLFIPATFKVGRIDAANGHYPAETCTLACRDPNRAWLNAGNFRALVKYDPACKKDKGIEIMKAVTGAVEEFQNDPVTGFVIEFASRRVFDSTDATPLNRQDAAACVTLRDPRGFAVTANAATLMGEILANNLAVGTDGTLSGNFVWGVRLSQTKGEFPYFRLFEVNGKDHARAETEQGVKSQLTSLAFVRAADMKPGTVYLRTKSKDPRAVKFTRVLYLGEHALMPEGIVRALNESGGDYYRPFGSYWPKPQELILKELEQGRSSHQGNDERLPWLRTDWVAACRAFEEWTASRPVGHVFVSLLEMKPDWGFGVVTHVALPEAGRLGFDYARCVRVCKSWNEREFRAADDDQRIYFPLEKRSFSSYDLRKRPPDPSADGLLEHLVRHNENLIAETRQAMERFPPTEPSNIVQFKQSMHDLLKDPAPSTTKS